MRKAFLVWLCVIVGLFLMVGEAFPKSEVKVLMLTSPAMLALRDMIPKFEEKHPDIKVIWEDTAYADIHTKQMNDFIAHTGRYDVMQMDNPWLPEYAGGGFIENLEPWIEKAGLRLWKDSIRKWPPGVEKFPTIYLEDEIVPVLNFYGNWEGNLYVIPNMPGVQRSSPICGVKCSWQMMVVNQAACLASSFIFAPSGAARLALHRQYSSISK